MALVASSRITNSERRKKTVKKFLGKPLPPAQKQNCERQLDEEDQQRHAQIGHHGENDDPVKSGCVVTGERVQLVSDKPGHSRRKHRAAEGVTAIETQHEITDPGPGPRPEGDCQVPHLLDKFEVQLGQIGVPLGTEVEPHEIAES